MLELLCFYSVQRERFPFGFFFVFVAKSDDYECTGKRDHPPPLRMKTVHFTIHEKVIPNLHLLLQISINIY